MSITEKGFEARRFPEILEAVRLSLQTNLNTPISTDPTTVIGVISSIFADSLSTAENNVQAMSENLNPYAAEGSYLDRIAAYRGIQRFSEASSTGNLKVWRNAVGDITNAIIFSTTGDEQFITSEGLSHQLSSSSEVLITPVAVSVGISYVIQLNNANFQFTSGPSDTATDVVNYFASEITSTLGITASNESDKLRVVGDDNELNSLDMAYSNFTLDEIASFNFCEKVLPGFFSVQLNTITEIVTVSEPSILRSNNPLPFVNGRDRESDEELRQRFLAGSGITGVCTVGKITASLLQEVANVESVFINENRTLTVDSNSLPGKSYECFVVGGSPSEIGQKIWDTKSAGVETYGEITTQVVDIQNNPESVRWSRPTNVYIFVRVTYILYDEETPPVQIEDKIKNVIKAEGDTLGVGQDILPTRFIGPIYRAVSGIEVVSVEVGKTLNVNDTAPVGGYQADKLVINSDEYPTFTLSKIGTIGP